LSFSIHSADLASGPEDMESSAFSQACRCFGHTWDVFFRDNLDAIKGATAFPVQEIKAKGVDQYVAMDTAIVVVMVRCGEAYVA